MARDRSAAQPLQYADLDFVRPQRVQPVEAAPEALHVFTGQTGDEIDVHQRAGALAQPHEIGFRALAVLPS